MSTVDEIVAAITTEKIIIHRGQVFINLRDYDEVLRWERRGARVVPWFTLDEIESRKAKPWLPALPVGWEVHLLGACEPVLTEDENGDQVDLTRELLLQAARHAVVA